MLTDPRGTSEQPRTCGTGLTSMFGIAAARHVPHDLPVIGSPEHTALLSGSLDLAEIAAAHDRGPLVGFAPIVLDPAGPCRADLGQAERDVLDLRELELREFGTSDPGAGSAAPLPSRRSLRAGGPGATAPSSSLPTPRARLASPLPTADDPTPTGELARPFVNETSLADWVTLDDVPPPVSVDVFQRAVRAGLAPEEAAAVIAAAGGSLDGLPGPGDVAEDGRPRRRTRREVRARERALNSLRGVTARRLAKGGVLAITALGVVSSANPQTLGALGVDRDALPTPVGAVDFAGALAPRLSVPELSAEAIAARRAEATEQLLRVELDDAAADAAANAGTTAGDAVLDLAFQQDRAVEARRQEQLARVTREAVRNPRAFAAQLLADRGMSPAQYQCLNLLWTRESGWNYRASNPSSGAYGIAQALPGGKMASVGADWRTNPITQIKWGINYIESRYGTPCNAWSHSQATGWY